MTVLHCSPESMYKVISTTPHDHWLQCGSESVWMQCDKNSKGVRDMEWMLMGNVPVLSLIVSVFFQFLCWLIAKTDKNGSQESHVSKILLISHQREIGTKVWKKGFMILMILLFIVKTIGNWKNFSQEGFC